MSAAPLAELSPQAVEVAVALKGNQDADAATQAEPHETQAGLSPEVVVSGRCVGYG